MTEDSERDQMLDQALCSWVVDESLPPRFKERVWQRIACQEGQVPASPWVQLKNWIGQTLAQPSLAVGYVSLLLLTGLIVGYWQARSERAQTLEQLGSRYVQMVDPYKMPR